MNHVKIVIVGDGSIGKTCIMVRFTQRSFSTEYVPTVFDNKTQNIEIEGKSVSLSLWDTAGQEAYSRLRSVAYPNTDIFLVAFSVVNPDSFVNAKKWIPQLKREVPNAKILFVGSKIDLRDSINYVGHSSQRPLQRDQLEKHIRQQFNAPYLECSALTDIGVYDIFAQAAKTVLISRGVLQNRMSKSIIKPAQEQNLQDHKPCGYCQLI